ncbi:unnamed protein product [Prunus armeniaca]
MKCVDDMKTFQDAIMADHVYDFLVGLDDSYDKVRSDILWSDKVSSIENVFFMVCREAQHQITMLGFGTKIGEPTVAFASKNTTLRERSRLKRENLHNKAHVVVAPTSVADITTEHGPFIATPPPTLTVVSSTPTPQPPGNFGKAFHAYDTHDTGWIIDSGATNHMMYNYALFSTTLPPYHDHVLTANNVATPVMGAGSILLTSTLPLDKVLLVSSLSNDCTRMMWLYGMKIKSDVVEIFQRFYQMIQTQFMLHIKGVLHETTCPQTPQQNGVAESKNGQILTDAGALLLGVSIPKRFWMDFVTNVVYLLNRLPLRVLDFQTPMQKGYRCYHPATRRLYVSMDVTFIEDEMFFSDTPEHVLHGETSSEGHNWLDLQEGVVLDSLMKREEPTEPAEPAEPDTPAEPATLAEPATPFEPAILTDVTVVTEPIAPMKLL